MPAGYNNKNQKSAAGSGLLRFIITALCD